MSTPTDPPPPLPYRRPDLTPPPARAGHFFLGLLAGCLLSAVLWIGFWNPLASGSGSPLLTAIVLVVLAKILAATFCLVSPTQKRTGAGILASLLAGFLIFFSACATNLKL